MRLLSLHDRRAIEAIVARMDTDEIARCLDEGGLSAFAREIAAEELARRVLVDGVASEVRGGDSAWRVLDRALTFLFVLGYLASLAWLFGLLR